MKTITIYYNGNKNLPIERNHKTIKGLHQLSKCFNNIDAAIQFWIECEFYSGSISTLDEILPKDYNNELLNILQEEAIKPEEVFIDSQKEIYNLSEDYEY